MKKHLQIIIVLILSACQAWSQTCNISTLLTQADVDDFPAKYPGCKVINGDLSVVSTNIANLNGLGNITKVTGSVAINFNANLTSIAGLSGLEQIDGEINIEDNDKLSTLAGLENFVRPMGNVRVVYNENLTSISALSGLKSIPGFLSVGGNPALTSLTGLENLTRVDGAISIGDNANLADMKGIRNLAYVGNFFYLAKNNKLKDFQGLEKLSHVGERLEITTNSSLTSLLGLGMVDVVFHMFITNNPLLSNCAIQDVCQLISDEKITVSGNAAGCSDVMEIRKASGCGAANCNSATFQTQADIDNFPVTNPGCTVIGGDLRIVSTDITNLDSLYKITNVTGSIAINFNASLASIAGLSGLKQVDGEINIEDNDNLPTLHGLENFARAMGNVRVVQNENLNSIAALSGLFTIGGFLSVGENPALTSLTGLENLTQVDQAISIGSNAKLVDLAGLRNLSRVGTFFYIGKNGVLKDLVGLENLRHVGDQFQIMENPSLTSLVGLGKMNTIGHLLFINNPLLSDCAVQVVCDQVLTGYVSIYGNGASCSYDELRLSPACGPAPSTAIRINAGGGNFTTAGGQAYLSDRYAEGILRVHSIPGGYIVGTDDDELYRSERSSQWFQYSIPMNNGNYLVVLHFAEIWFGAPGGRPGGIGLRRFNIDVEGVRKFTDYDVYARAGGAMIARTEQLPVTLTDGVLSLNFTAGAADLPTISAIEVIPVPEPSEGETRTILVQADAQVEDGSFAVQNFGSDALLGVKDISGGPNRRTYLRFPIEGSVGNGVLSAKLRVYGYNHQANDGVLILGVGVDDDSWTENDITWNNAPAYRPTTPGGRVQVNATLKYWEMDVTEFVAEQAAGDKIVSLALFQAENRNRSVFFHSKENPSSNIAQLIITSGTGSSLGARKGFENKETSVDFLPELKSTVFPNPASRRFTVRLSEGHLGVVSLKLINHQGKGYDLALPSQRNVTGEHEIDLPLINPAAGIYLLKVESASKTEVVKLVINQ